MIPVHSVLKFHTRVLSSPATPINSSELLQDKSKAQPQTPLFRDLLLVTSVFVSFGMFVILLNFLLSRQFEDV